MFHFPLQTVKWPEGNSFYNSFFQYLRRWTQLYSTDHLPIISCHFASKTPAIWAPAPRLPRPSRDKCGRRAGPVERFTEHPQLISCDLCESEQSFFFACLEYVRYNRYYILYIDIVHFCIWPSLCRCFFCFRWFLKTCPSCVLQSMRHPRPVRYGALSCRKLGQASEI